MYMSYTTIRSALGKLMQTLVSVLHIKEGKRGKSKFLGEKKSKHAVGESSDTVTILGDTTPRAARKVVT